MVLIDWLMHAEHIHVYFFCGRHYTFLLSQVRRCDKILTIPVYSLFHWHWDTWCSYMYLCSISWLSCWVTLVRYGSGNVLVHETFIIFNDPGWIIGQYFRYCIFIEKYSEVSGQHFAHKKTYVVCVNLFPGLVLGVDHIGLQVLMLHVLIFGAVNIHVTCHRHSCLLVLVFGAKNAEDVISKYFL